MAACVPLARALPVSVTGLGVRETARVLLRAHRRAAPVQGLEVWVVTLAVFVTLGVAGGVVQLLGVGTGPRAATKGRRTVREVE